MLIKFRNRKDAGHALAQALDVYKDRRDVILLALPRGGVPLAYEISAALNVPMDIWLVRKLGVPGYEEYAMGALAQGDVLYLNSDVISQLNIPQHLIENVIAREETELKRRNNLYRESRPLPDLKGKTAILIDDGLATGATMVAAVRSLQKTKVKKVIVAVPVGPQSVCAALGEIADDVICLYMPEPFYGVGQWYEDFSQIDDREIQHVLEQIFIPEVHKGD